MHIRASSLATSLALIGVLTSGAACFGGGQKLSDEDLAGEKFVEGAKVKAAFGNRKRMQNGTILGQYGKLAHIKFADRHQGWVPVKEVEPKGAAQLYPEGDKCAFAVEDRVMAPWNNSGNSYLGTIDEVHGKMAHVNFDDGDKDWADCDRMKPGKPKRTKTVGSDDSSSGGGGGGTSDAVTKCRRGCNKQCRGASNKSKCVGQCRRACG